jgi:formate dehydrogenase major subunit
MVFGAGGGTSSYQEIEETDVIVLWGSNARETHPIFFHHLLRGVRNGARLYAVDPRRTSSAEWADTWLGLDVGSDIALANAVGREIIKAGLANQEFIERATDDFEAYRAGVEPYTLEYAQRETGVSADAIRELAHAFATANRAMICWTLGITEHHNAVDNVLALINLALLCGHVGRYGSGLNPLRGQNNVQGASDAGLIPMFYPDYQLVTRDDARDKFSEAWGGAELDPERGLTVTEIIASALQGGVRGMYMMGENPFLSDPNVNKVRKALSALEFLVVQDIFLTETAEFADVVLPASSYMEKEGTYTNTDRRVQIGRKVLEPPGEAREDWKVICDISARVGLPMDYGSPREVFDEMAAIMPNYAGLSYDNLGASGKLYPNPDPEHSDGTVVLFDERFGTDDGKAHLVPAEWLPAKELPDDEFPFILNTGRLLEHWHTGSMTRRSYALDAIEPEAHVYLNPDDAASMGVAEGDFVRVTSRRGSIELSARLSHRDTPGTCFIPFHFREAAANVLTIDEIDPHGKIPEFKFCAVKVEPAANGKPAP